MKYPYKLANTNPHLMAARLVGGEIKYSPLLGYLVFKNGNRRPIGLKRCDAVYNIFREDWWAPTAQGVGEKTLNRHLKETAK